MLRKSFLLPALIWSAVSITASDYQGKELLRQHHNGFSQESRLTNSAYLPKTPFSEPLRFFLEFFTSREAAWSREGVGWHCSSSSSDDCLIGLFQLHICHVCWNIRSTWDSTETFKKFNSQIFNCKFYLHILLIFQDLKKIEIFENI